LPAPGGLARFCEEMAMSKETPAVNGRRQTEAVNDVRGHG